jgi:hypothetical protein
MIAPACAALAIFYPTTKSTAFFFITVISSHLQRTQPTLKSLAITTPPIRFAMALASA